MYQSSPDEYRMVQNHAPIALARFERSNPSPRPSEDNFGSNQLLTKICLDPPPCHWLRMLDSAIEQTRGFVGFTYVARAKNSGL
jgi:hypothetical protein